MKSARISPDMPQLLLSLVAIILLQDFAGETWPIFHTSWFIFVSTFRTLDSILNVKF